MLKNNETSVELMNHISHCNDPVFNFYDPGNLNYWTFLVKADFWRVSMPQQGSKKTQHQGQFKLTPSIAVISGRNIITVHHISKHVTVCK